MRVSEAEQAAEADEAKRPVPAVPWHDSLFVWDNAATAQTFGVGSDYQSYNPTYEMMFRLAPRYYLLDTEQRTLSIRADVRLLREFTNSDTTTREGEWTFADTELWLATVQMLRRVPRNSTEFSLRAPVLVLPTSNISLSGGRVLGLGVGLGLDHQVPLRSANDGVLTGLMLRPRVGYVYNFVSAIVPVNDAIDRVRLDPDGVILPSDQLSGSAFAQHELSATLRAELDLVSRLDLAVDLGMRYAYRYDLPEVEVCGVADTGCTEVAPLEDASRWGVATVFSASLRYLLTDYLQASVGYANLASQLGADGRRQSVFYSPYARAFLSFTVVLDGLYHELRGETPPEPMHTASRERASLW
jgi:hypothetical protein